MLIDNWCRFVLSEGIMPSSLARLIRRDDANRNNVKLIAQILQQRESFKDDKFTEITNVAKTAFLNDNELCNWLTSIESILTIIITFANANNNTQDILNGAFSSFIKSCPLVSNDDKASYLLQKSQQKQDISTSKVRYKNNSSSAKINEFIAYLVSIPYSVNTINSYCTSINISSDIASNNLWEIEDATEMQDVFDQLKSLADFRYRNIKTHNGLSSSLQRYIEFLRNRAK